MRSRVLLTLLLALSWQIACHKNTKKVVVYVSEDRVFSEPILKLFQKKTGIHVEAVYDTEETKGTGVMNRLIAEKNNTRADVYWANEPIRAEVLKQKGITTPYKSPNAKGIPDKFKDPQGYWTGFSARARVLIVNKKYSMAPKGVNAYVNHFWQGKSVIANPLFGTTTIQMAALFTRWGDHMARAFLSGLKKNHVAISTSNGESADFVAKGKYAFSLVDSDDAINRIRQKLPVRMVIPDQEKGGLGCLILPNAVMMIRNAPHPDAAKKLVDFLLSTQVEARLANAQCAQIPLHANVAPPSELPSLSHIKTMDIDYAKLAHNMLKIQPILKEWMGL